MKVNDHSQNLPLRIGTIQIIAFVLLSILGARLYYLQVVKGEYYAERAENQRIRLIPIPAPRGAIFDRNGKLLVDSRPTFNITLAREPIKTIDPMTRLEDYSQGLGVDRQYLLERINLIKKQVADFESMVVKENATQEDIAWVEAHNMEFPELRVELRPQRNYPHGTNLAHILGYVGEISPKQLEKPEYLEKGFKPGDIIGKGGLEQQYDEFLRGVPGYRKVLVDSRGRVQDELEVVQPQSGQDLISTIDLDLQLAAEQQLANSATKRGTIVAMDPNNGEILAMASAPSFDPNVFVKGSTTPEGRREIRDYSADKHRPLLNRAIQGRYPPGSTWKIPESLAGLQQGAITAKNSNLSCGGGIQIGSRFTRCMGSHGAPNLSYAITKSCNGYYYRLGLKMGIDGMIEMIENFEFDRRTGVDLPNEKVSQTPKSWKPTVEKREGRWSDIRTVMASIGQDTVVATPISILRAVSAVSVQGKLYVPHFLKEFKEISAVGNFPARPAFGFERSEPKILEMTPDQEKMIVDGMSAAVSPTIQIKGFDIAGKTGTAQVAQRGQGGDDNKDHAWFVSFAPAFEPQIAVIALIENSGFGGRNAAPAAKGVYEAYLQKTRPELLISPPQSTAGAAVN